jgi:hypothetical protein
MFAGQHGGDGQLEAGVEFVVVEGDEQRLAAVLDSGSDVEIDDPLCVGAAH